MIIDLPNTTTSEITKKLVSSRADAGAMAVTRVLTLVIEVDEFVATDAITVASDASRQHPSRIIVVVRGNPRGGVRMDAQLRYGGEAGASEVIVLRLYGPLTKQGVSVVTPLLLPDSPIVAWWPGEAPADPSQDPIGAMAQRRITDSAKSKNFRPVLKRLAENHSSGDTDMAWPRITLWRGLLAAALDQPPYEPVTAATVTGAPDSPSADLLAAWLAVRLKCPVRLARSRNRSGIISVRLERPSGPIDLVRPQDGDTATLASPGNPERMIPLAHRSDVECLADELRRLDNDEIYAESLVRGIPLVTARGETMTSAVKDGAAPSPAEAAKELRKLRRVATKDRSSSEQMVKAAPPSDSATDEQVQSATRAKAATKRPSPEAEADKAAAKRTAARKTAARRVIAEGPRAGRSTKKAAKKS